MSGAERAWEPRRRLPADAASAFPLAAAAGTAGDWTFRGHRRRLRTHPELSRGEEAALAVKAREGDRAASEQLVLSQLAALIRAAGWYRHTGVDPEDLVQAGWVALLEVLPRFDPRAGVRLATFAKWPVKAAMDGVVAELGYAVALPVDRARKLASASRGPAGRAHPGAPRAVRLPVVGAGVNRLLEQHARDPEDVEAGVLDAFERYALAKALARAAHWWERREQSIFFLMDRDRGKPGRHEMGYASGQTITLDWAVTPGGAVWRTDFGRGDPHIHTPRPAPIPGVETTVLHFGSWDGSLKGLASDYGVTPARINQIEAELIERVRKDVEGHWLAPFRPPHAGPFLGPEVFAWDDWEQSYIPTEWKRAEIAALEVGRDVVVYARSPSSGARAVPLQVERAERHLRRHGVRSAERELPRRHSPAGGVYVDAPCNWKTDPEGRTAFRLLLEHCRANDSGDTMRFVVMDSPLVLGWFYSRGHQWEKELAIMEHGWYPVYLRPFATRPYSKGSPTCPYP